MRNMIGAKVFISHSHADLGVAIMLDRVLKEHAVETFFNHDCIESEEVLPETLAEGIAWCNQFLLLWSINAARSTWVSEQWDQAYGKKKKILAYLLDRCPLPDVLDGHIFIDAEDQWRGHGKLLAAILEPRPERARLYAGNWCATVAINGACEAVHDLELHPGGQISGTSFVSQTGRLARLMRQSDMAHLLNLQFPVRGEWRYEEHSQQLTLDFTAEGLGMSRRETIKVETLGRESATLTGEDRAGRTWVVKRLS